MNPLFREFKRKFSLSMYKNLRIVLGEMSFFKDFTDNARGDLYPVTEKSADCEEFISNNLYNLKKGSIKRLFCQFFPFATYELSAAVHSGKVGFCFNLAETQAEIRVTDRSVTYSCGDTFKEVSMPDFIKSEFTLIVSCRPSAFDIYFKNNGKAEYFCTFTEDKFKDSNKYSLFCDSYIYLCADGNVTIKKVVSYLDNGVSIADIKPVKYENGEAITEQGNIWFTASVRMQEGSFQGVFSWVPGTAQFNMTGALFYDCGDGFWRNYVAPVIVYDRNKKQWYVWVSSFEHKHILAHGSFEGDPRFGVNVIDVNIMEEALPSDSVADFIGFKGDEDPDLIFDYDNNRWLFAVCRINPSTKQYNYYFFESDNPFNNFKYIGSGLDGAETGGSFVKAEGEIFFVCGNGASVKSEYRIYSKDGVKTANFNYPDGGFRGWGTVIPIKLSSRTRYFWLTFDRCCGSNYNWSYGNLYCFEL